MITFLYIDNDIIDSNIHVTDARSFSECWYNASSVPQFIGDYFLTDTVNIFNQMASIQGCLRDVIIWSIMRICQSFSV